MNKGLKYIKVFDLKCFMPESHSEAKNTNTSKTKVGNKDGIHNSNQFQNNNLQKKTKSHNVRFIGTVGGTEEKTHENHNTKLTKQLYSDKTRMDTLKSKVKFRSCRHTPEELVKLTEHCDASLVKLGDTFDSRESFRQYLNDNAKSWFCYYVCRNSKEKIIEYNCICMAYNLKPREIVIRKQKKRTTACPCKIRLTCDQSTKKVVVYYVCNHHDHDVTETAFHQYPHAKYLPQHVKNEFLDLAFLGLDVELIQKYIHSLVGITIKRKDICSYVYKFKRNILQRSLTEDRIFFINELILSIQETFNGVVHENSGVKNETKSAINKQEGEQVHQIKTQGLFTKKQKSYNKINEGASIIFKNESEDSLFEDVLCTMDMSNVDVIVQYIDERGILCDKNGSPITNSSAIMQFINNYEHVLPDADIGEQQCTEDRLFSEITQSHSINEEICPINCESVHEINPMFEKTSLMADYVIDTKGVVGDEEISQALETVEGKHTYDRNETVMFLENQGLYAELDNFKRYYFVDHRYIKYDGDIDKEQSKNILERVENTDANGMVCSEYVKAPAQLCSAPIRYCNGHEALTLLTDPDAILSGAKFVVHRSFINYINERANRWFFYYSLVESGRSPEYYVYKCVYGKNRVSKNAYRARGLRKRLKLKTQCPCQIRLRRLESDPAYLTVLYSCNHHDHALDSQQFKVQSHSRRLSDHIKEEVKDMLALGASFDVLRNYLMAETGHKIYPKYFHNVKMKMRRENEIREFSEERLEALTNKIKDLQAEYENASEGKRQARKAMKRKREASRILMEDRFTQVGLDDAATQTMSNSEYLVENLDGVAEEVCIGQEDSFTPRVQSRLETRLQNISSHEDTLLKVKKLQESVRCDVTR